MLPEALSLAGDRVGRDGLQSFTGLTAGCHGNGGTRRQLGTGPAPAHWLAQAPEVLVLTSPAAQVRTGALWATQTQLQSTHLSPGKDSKHGFSGGDLQVAGKGATLGPSSPRSLGTSSAPDARGPLEGRWAENDSKLGGRGLGAWLTSAEGLGLHPHAGLGGTPRKYTGAPSCQLPGLRA